MADLVIKGHLVLTLAEPERLITDGAVAVTGRKIEAVGPSDRIVAEHGQDARVLETGRGLVMPGLVNAHTHVSMTVLRGLADDLPLMTWLNEHIFPAEAKFSADVVYWGAMLGIAEMIRGGTTCFCDMYLFEQEVARAVDRAGIRAVLGEVLYDFPSANYGPIENGLRFTADLIEQYRKHPLIDIAVEPHAAYTCSPELLQKCAELARDRGARLITHLSENREEVDAIRQKYGATPVRHLDNLGVLGPELIADHVVVLDPEEIELLARSEVKVVHNPESNMKLASGVAPMPELLAAGVTAGLGSDGPASNNNLDMFQEMDSAAKLHKVFRLDPTVMSAETVLGLATTGGAAVLGLEDRVGRLAPGFEADLIVLDLDQPHLTPMYHPESHLVYAAGGGDVVHSVIGGRVVMENRQLTTLDLEEIYQHINDISGLLAGSMKRTGA